MPSSSTVNVERLACPPTPPPRFDKFDVAVIHGWLACHPPSPPLPEPSPDPSPESSPDFSPARACSPSPSPAYRSRAIPLLSRPTPASPSRPKRRQPLQAIMSNNQRPKRNVREQSYKEPGPLIFDNPNEHENAKKGKMTSGQTRQGGGSPTKGSPSKKSGSLVNDYTEAITERMDNINPFANAPSLPHSSGIGGSGSSVPNNSGGSGNGSKRPSSPVRTTDDLRLLNKPVNQKQLANYRNYLPADALGLIRDVENLCLNIGILPSKLKVPSST
ncbi:hypothetical protein BDV95DRAFT_357497 [Massariosphaeria phaeospora]|uniref:Uncharacterized protein n=1 Tax=Massariosphaeria phaeospora TaxID=100035 RepID=A0A7C8IFF7_9PLEO|nr:hypothetical protein BDV95DRAFT_357497 [Massariosphaeria phaeospora]